VLVFLTALSMVGFAAASPALANAAAHERTISVTKPDPDRTAQNHSDPLPSPRDPDKAVREEFDAARAQASVRAWELFIARHGDHALATEARKELEKLKQKPAR
jgi:hypothetical protein